MASSFAWMEPLRPYLIGVTVLVLAFAWYQKLKPQPQIACQCEKGEKKIHFFKLKLSWGLLRFFAIVMTLFPYSSSVFYPEHEKGNTALHKENISTIEVELYVL